MAGILAMSPSMQCESAYGAEYFVFKKPFVCRKSNVPYVWKYFVVGINDACKKAFHAFETDEELMQFLADRDIFPESICGLDADLIFALQKAVDEDQQKPFDENKVKGLIL